MKKDKIHIIFLITVIVLSGIIHQALYLIIPYFLYFFLFTKNAWRINSKSVFWTYLTLFFSLLFIVFFQHYINKEINLFSLKGLFRYFIFLFFSLYLTQIELKTIEKFLMYLSYLFIFTLPIGLFLFIKGIRYSSFFEHPNHFAYTLICLITYHLIKSKKQPFLLFFLILNLVLTKSSGGLITLFALISPFILFYLKKINIYQLAFSFILLVAVLFSSDIIFYKLGNDLSSIYNIDYEVLVKKIENKSFGGYGSAMWRIIYWSSIVFEFLKLNTTSIILGTGLDSLTKGNYFFNFMYTDPHNDYIKIFVEIGTLGLVIYFWFVLSIYKKLKNKKIIIILLLPMFWGNIIVNMPFNIVYISLLHFIEKTNLEKQNSNI